MSREQDHFLCASNGAVVCTGGYLELNAIEVLSRNYDGLEISGSGQVLVDIQKVVAEGKTPSGSSNAIEVRGAGFDNETCNKMQEVESDLDQAILVNTLSDLVIDCQSVLSSQGTAVDVQASGDAQLNVGVANAKGDKPTVVLFASQRAFRPGATYGNFAFSRIGNLCPSRFGHGRVWSEWGRRCEDRGFCGNSRAHN